MSTNVAGIATHGNGAVRVGSAIGVNGVGAVVFLVGLAVAAGQIGTDLSTDTDTVALFDGGDILANLHDLANDLVANAKRKRDI